MKVNDYVRTKDYGFIKVKSFYYNEDMIHILDENCNEYDFSKELVDDFKSSPNIIDVLEEHDFVQMQDRGNRFYEIERDYTGKLSLRDIGWDEYEELDETNIPEIVSIITHEQMEQTKYEVGE